MNKKTFAFIALVTLSMTARAAETAREQRKREFLQRPAFQNNLTPEAHAASGSLPPRLASNGVTGEVIENRTPDSQSAPAAPPAAPAAGETIFDSDNQDAAAPSEVSREVASTRPFFWLLPLFGLLAATVYFVKRRK